MAEAFGLDVNDLPEGWTPLRLTAVVECLDEDGRVVLAIRSSSDLPDWVALGMFEAACAVQRSDVVVSFEDENGMGY